jgi:YVTN family beta-propeller protein
MVPFIRLPTNLPGGPRMRLRPAFLAVALLSLFPAAVRAGQSNSLLDVSPDGSLLLVANPDNGSVTVVDTAARKALHEIKVGEKPEGVTWVGAGPIAAVAVYREDRVVFLDARAGGVVASLDVADEPYGIVASKDGRRAWVTHEYPGTVSEIDLAERKVVRQLPAGSFVRGLCLSPDETRLYVTEFYTGILHAVDLKSGKVVDSWKGHSTDNLCRHVVVHPTRPKAYLTHLRSRIEIADGSGSIFPALSVTDLVPPNDSKRRTSVMLDSYNGSFGNVVCNPWEADLSPDGKVLYTIYAATDDMNVNRVLDDNYREIELVSKVRVGKNPRAIRVSPDGKTVYVYNAMDFAVSVHDAAMKKLATVTVCDPPKTPEWVRGKVLFNNANPPLTSRRWIACSSCHPDGHSDGRVWTNPEGQRKTPPMLGLAHTHPLHWSADRDEVQDFEYTIRGRLMQGPGLLGRGERMKPKVGFQPIELDEALSGRSKDLDAVAIYCNSFEFTLSPHAAAPGKLSASAERGKALFFNNEVGCASCHSGPYYSDSSLQKPYKLHDVGTGGEDKGEKMGPKYDTPTLLGVYRSAPYLHHGKAKTLHDVLTVANKGDRHGKTSHLKPTEVDDLVEFLKSLPYEMPPADTPNAVKFRVQAKKE